MNSPIRLQGQLKSTQPWTDAGVPQILQGPSMDGPIGGIEGLVGCIIYETILGVFARKTNNPSKPWLFTNPLPFIIRSLKKLRR
jgi:hypothetical protein